MNGRYARSVSRSFAESCARYPDSSDHRADTSGRGLHDCCVEWSIKKCADVAARRLRERIVAGAGQYEQLRRPPPNEHLFEPNVANVLLVDDDAENLSSLQSALESDGHQVSVAGDGQSALAILHHESIQFMITDYEMLDINGAELCRLVHAQHAYSELPILMLSAAPEPLNPWTSWGRFLRKPARFEELAAAIHAGVERRMITGKQHSRTVSVSAVLRCQFPAASRWQPVHAGCWP